MKTALSVPATPRGMSLVEILVCVSIIAIITAVSIPAYTGYYASSRDATARERVEMLNTAVHRFNEGNYELLVPVVLTDTTDELLVLRTLQYRNPVYPKVGSPYCRNNWNPSASSASADYRIRWAGSLFILLKPGIAGTGLKIDFEGKDSTTAYQFPSGYTMAGS